jgi:hypothetical protein
MARVPTNGKMAECTMESIKTIRKMDSEYTFGQTEELILVIGLTENRTMKESTSSLMALSERVSTKETLERNGYQLPRRNKSTSREFWLKL